MSSTKRTKRTDSAMAAEAITFSYTDNGSGIAFKNVVDSQTFYGESKKLSTGNMPDSTKTDKKEYVKWGADNKLPYNVIDLIARDEVMSANKNFNILCCYGSGIRFNDPKTGEPTTDSKVLDFVAANAIPRFFLEQSTDMKYFSFCVAVLILNKVGDKIVNIRHKEACYCRFEKADSRGRINRVFVADFETTVKKGEYEELTLLDEYNPLGHLRQLIGLEPGADGEKKVRSNERKFAICCKMPTPGNRYYPIPYYAALFRGDWYNIKQLIGLGKKTKIKNHTGIKYLVQINDRLWAELFKREHITDEAAKAERVTKYKEDINRFLSGIENSGKTLYSGYYVDPNGNEVQMVKISVIDTSKEGGDWSEDIQEASNMLCYADGVHPNLLGATPGKGQQNNSGSDKRELFTLKQSLEIATHDIMKMPLQVVAAFNKWDVNISIPMITLTTLDTHKDAEQVTAE